MFAEAVLKRPRQHLMIVVTGIDDKNQVSDVVAVDACVHNGFHRRGPGSRLGIFGWLGCSAQT